MREPTKEKGTLATPLEDIRVAEGKDLRTPGNGYTNRTTNTHVHHDVKLDVRPKRRKTTIVRKDIKLRQEGKPRTRTTIRSSR